MSKLRNIAIARELNVSPAALGLFRRVAARFQKAVRLPPIAGRARLINPRGESPKHTAVRKPPQLPANAAPFRPEVAGHVPPLGGSGKKVTGVMDLGGERVVYQVSGKGTEPARITGAGSVINDHVEVKTLSRMREAGVNEATLYLNKPPCDFTSARGADGCANILEGLMRPGEKITAYFPGPDGPAVRVFTGR